jgi:hypothetical protein
MGTIGTIGTEVVYISLFPTANCQLLLTTYFNCSLLTVHCSLYSMACCQLPLPTSTLPKPLSVPSPYSSSLLLKAKLLGQ